MLQGYHGDTVTRSVTISSLEQQPLKIEDIQSTIDDIITYELTTVTEGKKFTLEIKTKAGIRESFRGELLLKTSSQKKPEVAISIMGRVRPELKVAPQYLHFGIIDTKKVDITPERFERTVGISKVNGNDLVIEKIETTVDWIMAKAKTGEQGAKHDIVITLDKNNLPTGPFKEKIRIHTTHDEKTESVDVIIEGKVL